MPDALFICWTQRVLAQRWANRNRLHYRRHHKDRLHYRNRRRHRVRLHQTITAAAHRALAGGGSTTTGHWIIGVVSDFTVFRHVCRTVSGRERTDLLQKPHIKNASVRPFGRFLSNLVKPTGLGSGLGSGFHFRFIFIEAYCTRRHSSAYILVVASVLFLGTWFPWRLGLPGDSFPWDLFPWDLFPWDSFPGDSFPWDSFPWDSFPWDFP